MTVAWRNQTTTHEPSTLRTCASHGSSLHFFSLARLSPLLLSRQLRFLLTLFRSHRYHWETDQSVSSALPMICCAKGITTTATWSPIPTREQSLNSHASTFQTVSSGQQFTPGLQIPDVVSQSLGVHFAGAKEDWVAISRPCHECPCKWSFLMTSA